MRKLIRSWILIVVIECVAINAVNIDDNITSLNTLKENYPDVYEAYMEELKEQNLHNNREESEVKPSDPPPLWQWLTLLLGGTTTTQAPPLQPPTDCKECTKCGVSNVKRIVGGEETAVNQYPWIAILLYNNRFYCGASLINDRYVLACHCVHGFNPSKITVRLLEHDRSTDKETKTITRNVEKIIKHPRYSPTTFNNDIALIKMTQPVEFNEILNPVCLPTSGLWYTGYNGVVAGWGTVKEGGDVSNVLQHVEVPIISNEACRNTNYKKDRITDNMLCAGYPKGGKDSCQLRPLTVFNETIQVHQIAGVVSWGEGCAKPNYPGVYARVNRYLSWIMKSTVDSCPCTPS